jgi:hypothetical protein
MNCDDYRRAYSHGRGESVTRCDRRRGELGLESPRRRSPARANPRRGGRLGLAQGRSPSTLSKPPAIITTH